MKEQLIKQKLINILKNDFEIIEKISGTHYTGKQVKPDFAFRLPSDKRLFIVEIKDDTAINFNLTELIRQTINYKSATYDGVIPTFAFFTTYNLLKGISLPIENAKMLGLAAKLGVGQIHSKIDYDQSLIRIGIGNIFLFTYNILTCESALNFTDLKSENIGTKAASNRLSNNIEPV